MTKTKPHKWTFAARFRTNAYGWKGSRLACKRIKEAVSEIRKIARKDPLLSADGAIKLICALDNARFPLRPLSSLPRMSR